MDWVPGLATCFFVVLGLIHFIFGRRTEAFQNFESAAWVVICIGLVYLALNIADNVVYSVSVMAEHPLSKPSENSTGIVIRSTWESLSKDAEIFYKAHEYCRQWVLYVDSLRSVLCFTVILSPLSDVIGSATGWSRAWLFAGSWTFLGMYFLSKILCFPGLFSILITFGATLTTVPSLRKVGAWMFALALTYGPALVFLANVTASALEKAPAPPGVVKYCAKCSCSPMNVSSYDILKYLVNETEGMPEPKEVVEYGFSPDIVVNVAGKCADAAYAFAPAIVACVIGVIIAGALSRSLANAIGGTGVGLRF